MVVLIVPVIIFIVIVAAIHDVVVNDWQISNVKVDPAFEDITIVPGAPIKQEIDVSFMAKDSRWVFKFGNIQPAAYDILLKLDPSAQPINKCDPSMTKSCPIRTGGINHSGQYSEHFTIRWDTTGLHTFNIDFRVDGVLIGQLVPGVNIH